MKDNKTEQRERPDPDLLLSMIQDEQTKNKGRLKIFFGAVAGVGKTYTMLETAHKLRAEGVDVVIGVVVCHGRADTEALVKGLEQLPLKEIEYKGSIQKEFDIDKALERKPELILIDELAHTNIEGSRHKKRWQDVEELLDAGIDVYATLNVQHIESLHDVVAQITGVTIHERIPDSFLEKTFEIELIDLPPDELIQRLKDGKVYLSEQIEHALANFFQKGNLIALRELALRAAAERVDAQMEAYRKSHRVVKTWPASEKILVCVSPSPLSIRLVRAAKRMANGLKAKWIVAYVETPRQARLGEKDKARVLRTLKLAQSLGAEIVELTGKEVSVELIAFAKQNNVTKIIVGKPTRPRVIDMVFGSALENLVRQSGSIDVYVISGESAPQDQEIPVTRKRSRPRQYMMALLVVAICTGLAKLMHGKFEQSTIVMGYMLGVVVVAMLYGRGPSIMASFLSVAVFDFVFIPPHFTFVVSDAQYLITFVVMLLVALIISTLMVEVKQQAERASSREKKTSALYSLSRELGSTVDLSDLIKIGLKHIGEVFNGQVAIYLARQTDDHEEKLILFDKGEEKLALHDCDEGVANWTFKNKKVAGLGTDTLPSAQAIYIPLLGSRKTIGVLALKPQKENSVLYFEQRHLLETFANQIAIACERAYLSEENEKTHLMIKTEQLRSSLLSSVSHDLRTPLATITGAASSIIESSDSLSLENCKELAEEIYNESVRLNTLVKNLLDMTRLQSGNLKVKKDWYPIEEVIGSAIATISGSYQMKKNIIKTDLPDTLPLIPLDAILIQQVFFNLLDNAMKYTLDDAPIEIKASEQNDMIKVSVLDRGCGVSPKNREKIFHRFFQAEESLKTGIGVGAGLGLAIANGIIEAHGGKIWVEERPGGGSIFCFSLPLNDTSGELPKKPQLD